MELKKDQTILEIYGFDSVSKVLRPLYLAGVSAGFPSPADDYIDQKLDLNEYLIKHPAATFFVRVAGESMIGAGINHGDILIIDRSLEPVNKKIVIAVINGELTVKRLIKNGQSFKLVAENPDFLPLEIDKDMSFEVWGVATYAIHKL